MIKNAKILNENELDKVAGGQITEDEALATALAHVNLKRNQIKLTSSHLDNEDGMMVYEIEFVSDGNEYEFYIDTETGRIIKYEKDIWD